MSNFRNCCSRRAGLQIASSYRSQNMKPSGSKSVIQELLSSAYLSTFANFIGETDWKWPFLLLRPWEASYYWRGESMWKVDRYSKVNTRWPLQWTPSTCNFLCIKPIKFLSFCMTHLNMSPSYRKVHVVWSAWRIFPLVLVILKRIHIRSIAISI